MQPSCSSSAPLRLCGSLHIFTPRPAALLHPPNDKPLRFSSNSRKPPPAQPASTNAPIIDAISPDSVIEKPVPQPTITITGSNLRQPGVFDSSGNPTVTITHTEFPTVTFSAVAGTNFSGTEATIPAGLNDFNLLQAPLGSYDLTVTRPDGQSATVVGAFTILTEDEAGGDDIYIKHIGQWGGPVNDVDVVGDLAYLANGRMLRILDISDPSSPVQLGAIDLGGVAGVRVRDGYAFVAARQPYGFCVVDVSDPTAPELVWSHNSIASREQVDLYGDYAYVRPGWIYDISDPLNVVSKGGLATGNGTAVFTIDGDRLYVGTTGLGDALTQLRIYDLASNPTSPPLLAALDAPFGGIGDSASTRGIAAEGDRIAWTVDRNPGGFLFVVDVADPSTPAIIGSREYGFGYPTGVAVSNGLVYVTDSAQANYPDNWHLTEGLVVLNASTPANLIEVAAYRPHGDLRRGLRVIGDRAYLFCQGEGLIIMDVTNDGSNPFELTRLGKYHSPSSLRQSVKVDDLLFVSDRWHGFSVLNVADPAQPQFVNSYQAEHIDQGFGYLGVDAWGIDYKNGNIYLGAGHLGLEVVKASNPSNMVLLKAYRFPPDRARCSFIGAVTVRDDVANVAHTGFIMGPPNCVTGVVAHVLFSVDIASSTSTLQGAELGYVGIGPAGGSSGSQPRTIAMNECGIASVGRWLGTDRVFNIVNPASPFITYPGGGGMQTLDVVHDGNIRYLVDGNHINAHPAISIQDISDPANPVDIASIHGVDDMNSAQAIAVQNDRLYVSAVNGSSVRLFDVTNPAVPKFIARSISGALGGGSIDAWHVLADEPHVYHIGQGDQGGLAVLNVVNLPLPKLGDLNDDGAVNGFDLVELLANWGSCPQAEQAGGNCCADNCPDGGCGNAECEQAVCNIDPFCCWFCWDAACGDLALNGDPALGFDGCGPGACSSCPPAGPSAAPPCDADLNGDGEVNGFDLVILLANWG